MRIVAAVALLVTASCSPKPQVAPSFLVVELDANPGVAAAHVDVANEAGPVTTLCVRLGTTAAPASFVLQRDPDHDAKSRVTIDVDGYADLEGDTTPGKQFACPPMLPPEPVSKQSVSADFCATESKRLVFQVGATCCGDGGATDCGCAGGTTCGAGLSTAGHHCFVDECCAIAISDGCALDPAK